MQQQDTSRTQEVDTYSIKSDRHLAEVSTSTDKDSQVPSEVYKKQKIRMLYLNVKLFRRPVFNNAGFEKCKWMISCFFVYLLNIFELFFVVNVLLC